MMQYCDGNILCFSIIYICQMLITFCLWYNICQRVSFELPYQMVQSMHLFPFFLASFSLCFFLFLILARPLVVRQATNITFLKTWPSRIRRTLLVTRWSLLSSSQPISTSFQGVSLTSSFIYITSTCLMKQSKK